MKQKDKGLLRDLCSRLPYGVIAEYYDAEEGCKCDAVIDYIDISASARPEVGISQYVLPIEEVKPYLFPMSSMTKEQMEELKRLCNMYVPDDYYHRYAYMGIEVFYKHVHNENYEFSSYFNTDVIDWLNKNHFDYRGLIEKGLAIDATGLNIY